MSLGRFDKKEVIDIISCSWSPYWLRPGSPTGSIQFNSGGYFAGSSFFTYDPGSGLYFTGSFFISGAISASYGPNSVGFYGTASWAQNAISSSYALNAEEFRGQLPVPKLRLISDDQILELYDNVNNTPHAVNQLILSSRIQCIVQDFSDEFLQDNDVYIEMLVYKRKSRSGVLNKPKAAGYVVPSPHYTSSLGPYPAWGENFWTRAGEHKIVINGLKYTVGINRPNHFKVNSINEVINLSPMLNGRHIETPIAYRDITGSLQFENCIVPLQGYRKQGDNEPTNRYSYSSWYQHMYISFRYVLYDPAANGGSGQIYSGPTSRIIKVKQAVFPFRDDYTANIYIQKPTCTIHPMYPANKYRLNAYFESNLP